MRLSVITQLDHVVMNWLYQYTQHRQCRRIVMISRTGDGHLYLLIGILLWLFEPEHGKVFLYTALMAYALEIPVFLLLKKLFKRARPADLLHNFKAHIKPSDKFSLPSGHTAAAFLMASMLSHFYPLIAPLAYGWAMSIGCSRVILGVHYPTDVVLGAMLGTMIGMISLLGI
jgi:undecaprenyl-diphosphatase